jgi:uncharacterized membrane protein YqiK
MSGLLLVGVLAALGLIIIVGGMVIATRVIRVPEADEAIVITGAVEKDEVVVDEETGETESHERAQVIVGGRAWVYPFINKARVVSLAPIQIPVQRKGQMAVPDKDGVPIEIEGELTVHVDGTNPDQVWLASQKLGEKENFEREVLKKGNEIIAAALRTAVRQFDLKGLNDKKEEFEESVGRLLQKDLAHFGLTLTAVSLPTVRQGKFTGDPNDQLEAEGRQKVAAAVEQALTATNDIEQTNKIARQTRDVKARENELKLQLERKSKEADNVRKVAEYEATQATAQEKAVLLQQQEAEEARAAQERAIAEARAKEAELSEKAEIAKAEQVAIRKAQAESALKAEQEEAAAKIAEAEAARKVRAEQATQQEREAEIAKNKAVETAKIEKEQSVKVADEQRQQKIEEAEVERQKAVALKRAEEAAARAEQATAEAKQKEAEEKVLTAQETEQANRQKQIVTIKAEEEAAQEKIAADKVAYVVTKRAEGERDAATKMAEAKVAQAEGIANAQTTEAKGYAEVVKTKADADAEASEQQAKARTKLAEALLEEGKAEAESVRLRVEAENKVAIPILARDVIVKALETRVIPESLGEIMAPVGDAAGKIQVLQVNGLGGGEGGGASIPETVLGTGLALTGALPVLKSMVKSALENPDVQEIVKDVSGVATTAIGEVARAAREGAGAPQNGG